MNFYRNMINFLPAILFILGLAIGSFLNALIYRLHTGDSITKGRSKCPQCRHELSWKDLIPVVSYIVLKGKCRYCQKPISWQYPVVEVMTGILFFLVTFVQVGSWELFGVTTGNVLYLVFSLFIVSVMIVIFVYDLRHYLILDKVLLPTAVIAFAAPVFLPQISLPWALVSSGVIGGFFLVLVLLSKERWMGWGDVKLGFLVGLILPWPLTIVVLLLAFVGGSVISLLLVGLKIKSMKDSVPFGTFLAAATIITLIWGQAIADWYLGLIM